MKNLDINNVPNSVLVATSIKELYFWLLADDDHDYRNRMEMLKAVTGKDKEMFYKLFYGEYFYILDVADVCNRALNYAEFLLKNDVKDRLENLKQTLETAKEEGNNSPETEKLARERFLLWCFDEDKKQFIKEIKDIAAQLNNPKNPNLYVFSVHVPTNNPLAISDSSVVSGLDNRYTYYIEGKKEWAEIDKRLDALKRELSTTATNGV